MVPLTMDSDTIQLVIEQMVEVQSNYPDLELLLTPQGEAVVRGVVRIDHTHAGNRIRAQYEIEIDIPREYPDVPPDVRETSGAIGEGFHTFRETGHLCLGAPAEVRRSFAQDRTLRRFMDRLVAPFLFSHAHWQLHGEMPYGELAHGYNGILDYYNDQFGTADDLVSLRLLNLLTRKECPGDAHCPCESGRNLCECHGSTLEMLRPNQTPEEWYSEFLGILQMFQNGDRRTAAGGEPTQPDPGHGIVKTPTAPTKQDERRPNNGCDPHNFTSLASRKQPMDASHEAKTAPAAHVRRSLLPASRSS